MPKDIQLHQPATDRVVVEMSRDRTGGPVIGRMLDRRKMMHIHMTGHNHNPTGMLTGSLLHAGAAPDQSVDVCIGAWQFSFFKIVRHITVGGFFGDRTDCPGTKHIVAAEQFFGIFVRCCLIIARKIQIDIWHLIAFKPHEHGKWNVVSIFGQPGSAERTIFVRQVKPAAIQPLIGKLSVPAGRATPVRRQRIDFGNAGHRCHKRGTDRTARADQISFIRRFFDQFVRNQI